MQHAVCVHPKKLEPRVVVAADLLASLQDSQRILGPTSALKHQVLDNRQKILQGQNASDGLENPMIHCRAWPVATQQMN